MTDVVEPEALTDEAILARFLRTKNQPTGSQTLVRSGAASGERAPADS